MIAFTRSLVGGVEISAAKNAYTATITCEMSGDAKTSPSVAAADATKNSAKTSTRAIGVPEHWFGVHERTE